MRLRQAGADIPDGVRGKTGSPKFPDQNRLGLRCAEPSQSRPNQSSVTTSSADEVHRIAELVLALTRPISIRPKILKELSPRDRG